MALAKSLLFKRKTGGPAPEPVHDRAGAAGVPGSAQHAPVQMLVCLPVTPADVSAYAYAQYLAGLLHALPSYRRVGSLDELARAIPETGEYDLVVTGEAHQPVLARLLLGPAGWQVASRGPASLLVAERPRWPLRHILLVLRVEAVEAAAVDWAGRMAHASGAQLTILPLAPAQPLMYGPASGLQVGIEALLAPNTPSGGQLRRFLQEINEWQVNAIVRVRQGEPLEQIRWELDEGEYDLIVLACDQQSHVRRWLFGDLVGPLLGHITEPVLIAKPRHDRSTHAGNELYGGRGSA